MFLVCNVTKGPFRRGLWKDGTLEWRWQGTGLSATQEVMQYLALTECFCHFRFRRRRNHSPFIYFLEKPKSQHRTEASSASAWGWKGSLSLHFNQNHPVVVKISFFKRTLGLKEEYGSQLLTVLCVILSHQDFWAEQCWESRTHPFCPLSSTMPWPLTSDASSYALHVHHPWLAPSSSVLMAWVPPLRFWLSVGKPEETVIRLFCLSDICFLLSLLSPLSFM